jgi:hydroxyacid-oxoacid transhydrogenase
MLAATFAGIGFGNAGVHLPHGMSYPISGMVRNYHVEGYPEDHRLIPHGMSVILSAPAVFRFTARADPQRHLYAASLLGVDITHIEPEQAGEVLAQQIISLMYKAGMPNGLREVGYCLEDIDLLVEGTLPQHRVTKLSPLPVTEVELRQLFRDSLTLW